MISWPLWCTPSSVTRPLATCLPGERVMRLSTLPGLRKDFVRACDTPKGSGYLKFSDNIRTNDGADMSSTWKYCPTDSSRQQSQGEEGNHALRCVPFLPLKPSPSFRAREPVK